MNDASPVDLQCPIDTGGQTQIITMPVVRPTPPVAKEVRVVTDVIPVLDTAKFEHMQRIATVMAQTSMIPDALCTFKNDDGTVQRLPQHTVLANCFMVVNQAVRWEMDPFAVAQCASVVHGRLMWEGKLIAAVIEARLGIRLLCTFTNNAPDRRYDDQSMGVVVSGKFRDETEPRTIKGTVSQWHKGGKSPWANPLDWERQLRYRGAREWARAHAPSVLLGVYGDDEFGDQDHKSRPIRSVPVARIAPDIPDEIEEAPPAKAVTAEQALPTIDLITLDERDFLELLREERSWCASDEDVLDLSDKYKAELGELGKRAAEAATAIMGGAD